MMSGVEISVGLFMSYELLFSTDMSGKTQATFEFNGEVEVYETAGEFWAKHPELGPIRMVDENSDVARRAKKNIQIGNR